MARVTVEDCLKKLNNKFELSVLSSYRAKEISKGSETEIGRRNDKNTVIALRELASEHLDVAQLKRAYIHSLQLCIEDDDVSEDERKLSESKIFNEEFASMSPSSEILESEFISVEGEEPATDSLNVNKKKDKSKKKKQATKSNKT